VLSAVAEGALDRDCLLAYAFLRFCLPFQTTSHTPAFLTPIHLFLHPSHRNIFRAPHSHRQTLSLQLCFKRQPLGHIAPRNDMMAVSTPSGSQAKLSRQNTTHFFNLPAELQVWILEYMVSSSDKRNLSLVCKQMQALMLPCLYRHMTLHPLQLNENLRSVFNKKHPGLPHIQTLHIRGITYGIEKPNLMPVLCRVLKSIPKDALRVFE